MGAKAKIPNGTNLIPTRSVGRGGYAIVNNYHQSENHPWDPH